MRTTELLKRNKPREVLSLIRHETRLRTLKSKLDKYHAFDISEAILLMDDKERERLYKNLNSEKLAHVFEQLDEEKAVDFIHELEKRDAVEMLELMEPDDAIDILQELSSDESTEYLALMDEGKREKLRRLSRYKHSSAGSEMNSLFLTFNQDMDVKEAMKKLVEYADDIEMIDTLFVVDDDKSLIGVLDLKELIVAKHPKKVKNIMREKVYSVHVEDDIQEVVRAIQKYDTLAMPVLNDDNQIEGIITMYDALDIIEEEAHDDYAKLAAISTEHDMRENSFKSAKRRFPWLALLLILNILVASVLATFEDTIDAVTALVLFQPLILGMAGNIGTQSLAVTILGISRETLTTKLNITRHLSKEFFIGLVNGLILGGLAFFTAWIFLTISPVTPVGLSIEATQVASVVGLSVLSALTVSAFLGSLIPIILNSLKIDPAIASGPFITTINDITALMVYFGLATLLILPYLQSIT